MQQLHELRGLPRKLGDQREWFQLGVVSATVLAPLVSRWRSLHAAERARALWAASQANARWPWTHPASEEQLPPLARRDVRTGLWLAGVAVGLAATGTLAFVIARRRMRVEEEPLELPLITRVDTNGSFQESGESVTSQRNGMGHTPVSASDNTATTPHAQPDTARTHHEPPAPLFVGNTQTLLYTPADNGEPPPEEVRIYFASEAQARQAGYHAAPGYTKLS